MKFSTDLYGITDGYELKLKERTGLFRLATKNKKALVVTFVTTYGVVNGKHERAAERKEKNTKKEN